MDFSFEELVASPLLTRLIEKMPITDITSVNHVIDGAKPDTIVKGMLYREFPLVVFGKAPIPRL